MKITESRLRRVIREELRGSLVLEQSDQSPETGIADGPPPKKDFAFISLGARAGGSCNSWYECPDEVTRDHDIVVALGVAEIKLAGSGGFVGNRNPRLELIAKEDARGKIYKNLDEVGGYYDEVTPENKFDGKPVQWHPGEERRGLPKLVVSLADLKTPRYESDYMHGRLIDGVYYQSFEYKCKTPCTG